MEQNKIIKYQDSQLYKISNVISLTEKILEIDLRRLSIIHLDDQQLFLKGVRNSLLDRMPNILIHEFPDNAQALSFITTCLQSKIKIDLIITDFNHPGPNGLSFAKDVRELERNFDVKIPIMLLTMNVEDEILLAATEEGIFDGYYSKNCDAELLVRFVQNHTDIR